MKLEVEECLRNGVLPFAVVVIIALKVLSISNTLCMLNYWITFLYLTMLHYWIGKDPRVDHTHAITTTTTTVWFYAVTHDHDDE